MNLKETISKLFGGGSKRKCPKCGSTSIIRGGYGEWACKACHARFHLTGS